MNSRQMLINFLLTISSSNILKNLEFIRKIQYKDKKYLMKLQEDGLKKIIIHAYEKVPYYNKLLKEFNVIKNGTLHLENFSKLPLLTKDKIRKEGKNLYSHDRFNRGYYRNFTSGSTGEPISFIQDKYYLDWNIANKLFYLEMAGKCLGEKEIKLWASERDLQEGTKGIRNRVINFLYNRRVLDCLEMTEKDMERYTELINQWRPKIIWSYANAVFELAKYADNHFPHIHPPSSIISCATTLYPNMREEIERIFKTKVYNQYGGREVGDIACECKYNKMHIFDHTHFVEIVDKNNNLIKDEIGHIIVTSLTNYSMPFLRYKIEDMGQIGNYSCECSREFNFFKEFVGRDIETFYKRNGEIVFVGCYLNILFDKIYIKKFQLIQEDYDLVNVKLVLNKNEPDLENKLVNIRKDIQEFMGKDCRVEFEVLDELNTRLLSGKNIIVISKVQK